MVKVIICRRLYPNPDLRMSSDEDVLIPPDQFAACHEVMTRLGMVPESDDFEDYEIPYSRPGGALYVELHKSLFPDESEAYGHFNRFFQDIRSRMVEVDGIPTMAPTDHMLPRLQAFSPQRLRHPAGLRSDPVRQPVRC